MTKSCESYGRKHKWRVGSFIGKFGKIKKGTKLKITKIGINIYCVNCQKKIRAYYKK